MAIQPVEIITGNTLYPAPFTHRVFILCEEKNIPYTITQIDTENKPEWFLAIAPLGLVPVMRTATRVIPDSHAICEHLDKLAPPYLFSDNAIWMNFADTLADEIAKQVKQGTIQSANLNHLCELLEKLDKNIQTPFFFGDQLSLVDIYLVSHLLWLDALEEKKIATHVSLKKFQRVTNWLQLMKQRSSVKRTMGEKYAEHFTALLRKYGLIT